MFKLFFLLVNFQVAMLYYLLLQYTLYFYTNIIIGALCAIWTLTALVFFLLLHTQISLHHLAQRQHILSPGDISLSYHLI